MYVNQRVNTEYYYSNKCCFETHKSKCNIKKYNDTNVCITHFREILWKFIKIHNKYKINENIITKKYQNLCKNNNIPYYRFIYILSKYQRNIILRKYKENENSMIITDFIRNSAMKNNIKKMSECVICYDKIKNKKELAVLKCGHYFHKDCIKKCSYSKLYDYNSSVNCPYCREKIDTFYNMTFVIDFKYKFDKHKLSKNSILNNVIKKGLSKYDNITDNEIFYKSTIPKYSYEGTMIIEELIKIHLYHNLIDYKLNSIKDDLVNYIQHYINNNINNSIYFRKNKKNKSIPYYFNVKFVNKINKYSMPKNIKLDNEINFTNDIVKYHEQFCKKNVIKSILIRILNKVSDVYHNIDDEKIILNEMYDIIDFETKYHIDYRNIDFNNINLIYKYFDEYIKSNLYYILNSSDNRGKNIKDIIYIDINYENKQEYIIYINYENLVKHFILLIKNYYNGKIKSQYDTEREKTIDNTGWEPKRYQTTDINDRKWFFNITNDNYGIFNNLPIDYENNFFYHYCNKYNCMKHIRNSKYNYSITMKGIKHD